MIAILSYFVDSPSSKLFMIPFASSALCWLFDSLLDLIMECTTNLESKD